MIVCTNRFIRANREPLGSTLAAALEDCGVKKNNV